MRQLQAGRVQPAHRPSQQPQPLGAVVLLGALEQQLHPQAQPEQRYAGAGPLDQELLQPELTDRAHPGGKGADAGQHQTVHLAQKLGVAAGLHARADVLERLFGRAAIAHAVVDQPDTGGPLTRIAHEVRVPFVLGTPVSVGSIATAWRSARANALNAASIM